MISSDPRDVYMRETLERVNSVISEKWPDTLRGEADPYGWAREHAAELMEKRKRFGDEADSLYVNKAPLQEFKDAFMAYAKNELAIFQGYAAELNRREAA